MRKLALSAGCLFVFFLMATAFKSFHAEPAQPLAAGYQIGEKVDDFSLKNVDGKMVSLADYKKAKGFVIIFTCNHCPYAIAYEDRVVALAEWAAAKDFQLIAINPNDPAVVPDDSPEEMKTRAVEKKFGFPYLFDDGQKVYPKFGATRTPHVFVLDKKRRVQYIGAIDDNSEDASAVTKKYVENAIDALLAGKKPEPNSTKAVGCSIKKKK